MPSLFRFKHTKCEDCLGTGKEGFEADKSHTFFVMNRNGDIGYFNHDSLTKRAGEYKIWYNELKETNPDKVLGG